MTPKIIQTESRPYMGGLGDTILLAWLAEAAKNTDEPVELYASGHRQFMLECLGIPVAKDQSNAIVPSEAYSRELADNGRRPRWEYVADYLRIKTGIKRPTPNIPEQLIDWAKEQRKKVAADRPFVLLFPQTHWKPREWPQSSWLFLGHQLKQNGITPVFLLDKKDDRYCTADVMSYWGYSLGHIMALMQIADVVVGNDSMPAHLAGTLGCKTIAIMGPTKPSVFAHIPDVQCLTSSSMRCTGCHFSAPFSRACDVGCSALASVSVHDVLDRIRLNLENRPVIQQVNWHDFKGETHKAHARRVKENWFAEFAPEDKPGIDIGCGNDPLNQTFKRWDKKEGDATFMEGVPDESFHTVYASHVLEHLPDPMTAVGNWWRITAKGGHLIVNVPHRDLYERKTELPSKWNTEHKTFWLPDELKDLLEIATGKTPTIRVLNEGWKEVPLDVHPVGEYSIEGIVEK
ncbi:MAG: glycosyltransferase family 9 protein [Planctomycetaceae bacterium]